MNNNERPIVSSETQTDQGLKYSTMKAKISPENNITDKPEKNAATNETLKKIKKLGYVALIAAGIITGIAMEQKDAPNQPLSREKWTERIEEQTEHLGQVSTTYMEDGSIVEIDAQGNAHYHLSDTDNDGLIEHGDVSTDGGGASNDFGDGVGVREAINQLDRETHN